MKAKTSNAYLDVDLAVFFDEVRGGMGDVMHVCLCVCVCVCARVQRGDFLRWVS